jgi:hypothetical protein
MLFAWRQIMRIAGLRQLGRRLIGFWQEVLTEIRESLSRNDAIDARLERGLEPASTFKPQEAGIPMGTLISANPEAA